MTLQGANGSLILLSPNPIHDTGGGARPAQIALEFLERRCAVLFVHHGETTETVDLHLDLTHPRLLKLDLATATSPSGLEVVERFAAEPESLLLTEIPVRAWVTAVERARAAGAIIAYDRIDEWDSDLGYGWYRRADELELVRRSELLLGSAPELVRSLEHLARRTGSARKPIHLLPNAVNRRIFSERTPSEGDRPRDLPNGERIALYVGALWGSWMDWALVDRMARTLPKTEFVFIGDHRDEGEGLPGNCHFLGLKPQRDLPPYLHAADVAFIPWRVDRITRATSPLKLYEFLATGLPVVSRDIEPLRGVPGVRLAPNTDAFPQEIQNTARATIDEEERVQMRAFAAENDWAHRVDRLLEWAASTPRVAPPGTFERALIHLRAHLP